MTGAVHVFCGITLTPGQAAKAAPFAVVHPPAWAGDLPRLKVTRGDCVLLVDTETRHADPPRHADILALLSCGVTVAGAGGAGAVRAAEMHPCGVTGTGIVYAGLRKGVVADDEASGPLMPPGCPPGPGAMRAALASAVAADAVAPGDAAQLAACAGAVPGPGLSWEGLEAVAGPGLAGPLAGFRSWAGRQARLGHVRVRDAREALRMAAAGTLPAARPGGPLIPPPRGGRVTGGPGEPGGLLPAELRRCQLHDPWFPGRWRRFVLDRAGDAAGGARAAGLPSGQARYWLTLQETRALPAGEQGRLITVRAAGCDPDAPVWPVRAGDVPRLRGPHDPGPLPPVSGEEALARLWNVPPGDREALTAAARDRAFATPAAAVRAAQAAAAAGPAAGTSR